MGDFQTYLKMVDSVQYPWMSRQQNGEWIFWRCSVFIMFSSNTWKTMMCGVNFTFNNNSWTKKCNVLRKCIKLKPHFFICYTFCIYVIFIYLKKSMYLLLLNQHTFLWFIFMLILWMLIILNRHRKQVKWSIAGVFGLYI